MIHLTAHTHILLATEPADFRMGIDGLAARCRGTLAAEPRSGCQTSTTLASRDVTVHKLRKLLGIER
ncbi:MAG: hypothetical protein ACJAU1_001644 [Psychromonas sp.]|jgi:hypothetical protein